MDTYNWVLNRTEWFSHVKIGPQVLCTCTSDSDLSRELRARNINNSGNYSEPHFFRSTSEKPNVPNSHKIDENDSIYVCVCNVYVGVLLLTQISRNGLDYTFYITLHKLIGKKNVEWLYRRREFMSLQKFEINGQLNECMNRNNLKALTWFHLKYTKVQ